MDEINEKLWRLVSKGCTLETACDALELAPKAVKKMLAILQQEHPQLRLREGAIGLDDIDDTTTQVLAGGRPVSPVVGDMFTAGVLSDPHFGSKYCLKEAIVDAAGKMIDAGAKDILVPGDLITGIYDHSKFEVSSASIDGQTEEALDGLPQQNGVHYHCITGNHDETFTSKIGVNVGKFVECAARDRGRDDIHFYGDRSAYISVGGIRIHMWHPKGSLSYARSYKLQKQIESYASGVKPKILLAGHFHQFCHVYERGVHAILCPTLQSGLSSFGKSLVGQASIGGLILRWSLTAQKTMRQFSIENINYFELEKEQNTRQGPSDIPLASM